MTKTLLITTESATEPATEPATLSPAASFVQTMQWRLLRLLDNISTITKLSCALLMLTLILYMFFYRPQLALFNDLSLQLAQPLLAKAEKKITAQDSVNAYVLRFPPVSQRAKIVNTFMQIAEQNKLLLNEVSYNNNAKNTLFKQYDVTFRLYASYKNVHIFLANVLTEMPFVAIDSLSLSRETVADELIEANIKLSFYFGSGT